MPRDRHRSMVDGLLCVSDRFVGQNVEGSEFDIRWARSATKHRISRERSRYVIERCGLVFAEPPPPRAHSSATRLLFLGDGPEGIAIEVIAIQLRDDRLLVIHAMQVRRRYRRQYEEARKWRR